MPVLHWLVCYDVAANRRRRRLAARLEAHGVRQQRSVFVCEATPDGMTTLERNWRALLAHDDDLRVDRLHQRGARLLGGTAPPEIAMFWIC